MIFFDRLFIFVELICTVKPFGFGDVYVFLSIFELEANKFFFSTIKGKGLNRDLGFDIF